MDNQFIKLENTYGAHNYKPLDVVLCRGEGVWVWDVDGTRYLDCLAAYSAVNQGHCHPRILDALVAQAKKLTLTSRAFRNDQLGPLYKDLCELTHSHKVLPMNSGAEAVETRHQNRSKMGLSGQRRAGGPGANHRLPQQFPWPHYIHCQFQHRRRLAPRVRPVHTGILRDPVR